ncbi:MAG TPA: peptide ABC transporter substrate-binding protein [Bacillota bacterium]
MKVKKFTVIALLIVALIATTALAGCSSGSSSKSKLIIGSLQEPKDINPLTSEMVASAEVETLIYEPLVQITDKLEWIPALAKEVPTTANGGVSTDGKTITYKLRNDVKWSDGKPFTSKDVKFTWQAIMDPKTNVVSRSGYELIGSIDTPDDYTAVLHMKDVYADFLSMFNIVVPEHVYAGKDLNNDPGWKTPVGTGPYTLTKTEEGSYLEFTANKNYYRGKPKVQTIIYKIVPDTNVMFTQLQTGEVDGFLSFNWNQLQQIQGLKNQQAFVTPGFLWEHIDLNENDMKDLTKPSIFADVKVRQAIMYAFDRKAVVDTVMYGRVQIANADQVPISPYYNDNVTKYTRDVAKAKALLAEAGWKAGSDGILVKNGKKFEFTLGTTAGNASREKIEQIFQQNLAEVGIKVNIKNAEAAAFFEATQKRQFEAALYAWQSGVDPDDLTLWHSKQIGEGQNYVGYKNAELDQLLDQGQKTMDVAQRKQIYRRVQEILATELPTIFIYYRATLDAVNTGLKNFKPNPTLRTNFWNAWEWEFNRVAAQ